MDYDNDTWWNDSMDYGNHTWYKMNDTWYCDDTGMNHSMYDDDMDYGNHSSWYNDSWLDGNYTL